MSKKPHKIEQAATPYAAKKSIDTAVSPKSTDDAAFKKISDKLFLKRKELLHKLAQ